VLDTFRSTRISGSGAAIDSLEESLENALGAKFCFAVSNGSAAIRMALLALGFRPGMRVILPGWGFHVAANIAFSMGAKIEFRDVDPDTWCMNLEGILESIGSAEDVFLVLVHTLGNTSDLDFLQNASEYSGLRIIEDAAEAMFSKFRDKSLGTIFDAGTFSFHAAKTITTGEGGLVAVNSPELADTCQLIRSHGMTSERPYFHQLAGDNFRLSNLLATVAIGQLQEIEHICQLRNDVYASYLRNLSFLEASSFLKPLDLSGFFPWGFGIKLGRDREKVVVALANAGIETRPGFTSASQLPYFEEEWVRGDLGLVNSDSLSSEVLLLPHYPRLSEESIQEICQIIATETSK
jgi:perosamine synthetase